jgi:hypothetical protein
LLVYRLGGSAVPTPTPIIDPPPPVYLPATSKSAAPSPARISMVEVATYGPLNTRSWALDVDLEARLAYVGREAANPHVAVMDVANPAEPAELGRSPSLAGRPERLAARDGFAYAALGAGGVAIIDARDPRQPTVAATIASSREVSQVAVAPDGRTLYVVETRSAGGETVLLVYDVTDKGAPVERGRVTAIADETATGIVVSGDTAFLTGPGGLVAVDVGNPIEPEVLGSMALAGAAEPDVTDGRAGSSKRDMVAVVNRGGGSMPGGLWLIDAAEPRAMVEAGSLVSLDWPEVEGARQVSWSADRVLMASQDDLRIIDATDFRGPRNAAEMMDRYADLWDVVLGDRYVFFTDGSKGLVIVQLVADR